MSLREYDPQYDPIDVMEALSFNLPCTVLRTGRATFLPVAPRWPKIGSFSAEPPQCAVQQTLGSWAAHPGDTCLAKRRTGAKAGLV
jgi:hypothetical protein